MSMGESRITIVGAGPAGNLLAIFLARRGLEPLVVERRAPQSIGDASGGRSINLALAARGLAALERAGIAERIEPLLLEMAGRMIHEKDGTRRLDLYGQGAHECIHSVSRAALNLTLYRVATEQYGVKYRFHCECRGIDPDTMAPVVADDRGLRRIPSDVTFAADGAGSVVRRALADIGALTAKESLLDHGYKELAIDAVDDGRFALDPGALHIWPRDDFMLIALPNVDRSFTATLFLPLEGRVSFAALASGADVTAFFAAQFGDAMPRIRNLEQQIMRNPTGLLGTVRCDPWVHHGARGGRLLLLGDAAHAIVPFHGQGMNAAFEDVLELDRLLSDHGTDWGRALETFEGRRVPNANAIADMALENYVEMRALVRDPQFLLRRELELELERRFPGRFIPRYAMVMFHPEISYAEAQRRGAAQRRLLERMTAGVERLADVDFDIAARALAGELD